MSLSGRIGVPNATENPAGGVAWRAGLAAAAGLEHPIGVLGVGAYVGLDLEWLQGHVELDDNRGIVDFGGLGLGILLRVALRVRIWRGLELLAAVEATARPRRTLYVVRGEPAASSGYVEVGLELGLGWKFL
jgi:hypothetical protein